MIQLKTLVKAYVDVKNYYNCVLIVSKMSS
jgi:hypothetical protein